MIRRLLLSQRRSDMEIDDELRFHIEESVDDLVARGFDEREARSRVLQTFSDLEGLRLDLKREARSGMRKGRRREAITDALREVHLTCRSLFRRPKYAAAVVLVLALGIGATTSIFSIVNGVLLDPLPFPDSQNLIGVWHVARNESGNPFTHADIAYLFYRRENRVFQDMGLYTVEGVNLSGEGTPQRVEAGFTSASLFGVLGVGPSLGTVFREEAEIPGAADVVVLSHGLWVERYGRDPDIVGKSVIVDGVPRTVRGVMPAGFSFPSTATRLWLPAEIDPMEPDRSYWSGHVIARLLPGVGITRARGEMDRLAGRLHEAYPDPAAAYPAFQELALGAELHPLKSDLVGNVSDALVLLMGGVGVLFLISCANVSGLALVRAEERHVDIAVRTAVGASRGRLARLLVDESMVLAAVAAILGIVLAGLLTSTLLSIAPEGTPRLGNVRLDGTVMAFSLGLLFLSGLTVSVAPLLNMPADPTLALRGGAHRAGGRMGGSRSRKSFAVVQITLSIVLMAASGLMTRSLLRLRGVETGIDAEGVLTVRLPLPAAEYPDLPDVTGFYRDVLDRVRALPGVSRAGATSSLPLTAGATLLGHSFEDFPPGEDAFIPNYPTIQLTPGALESLGVPLLAGRFFDEQDMTGQTGAVLLSAALASRLWPGEDPVGKRLTPNRIEATGVWRTVVGVVGTVAYEELAAPATEVIYYPQGPLSFSPGVSPLFDREMSLVVKTSLAPQLLADEVRAAVWQVDPNLPLTRTRTMSDVSAAATSQWAFLALLLMAGGGFALLLSVIGLFGTLSCLVSRRREEIGVRLALGAERSQVLGTVLREGLAVVVVGVGAGAVGALLLMRLLRSLLYQVSPADPVTLATVTTLVLCASLLGILHPARQAANVDPALTMKG